VGWHERLDWFVPCNGHGEFVMGDCTLVVVDNMKLHGIVETLWTGAARHGGHVHAGVRVQPDIAGMLFLAPFC